MEKLNRQYESPEVAFIEIQENDIITTSPGDMGVTGDEW